MTVDDMKRTDALLDSIKHSIEAVLPAAKAKRE
jgi:hypothetical protein